MKKIFIALLFFAAICGTVCAKANIKVDGVEFVGFGVDGKISLEKADFDVFQGVYLKNNSNETKSVYVTLQISGYNYRDDAVAKLKPGKVTLVTFSTTLPTKNLYSDYVTVTSY